MIYCGILWYIFLQGEESVVTCSDETRHNFQSGDYVTFSEVQVGLCVCVFICGIVCVCAYVNSERVLLHIQLSRNSSTPRMVSTCTV